MQNIQMKSKFNFKSFLIIFLFVVISNGLLNCKKNNIPARTGDYKKDMEIRLKLSCDKMNECNFHLFRTFPKSKDEHSENDCVKVAMKNFNNSFPSYNDEIKLLSLDCSEKIINVNCKKMIAELISNPSCYRLRDVVEKVRLNN